MPNGVSYLSEIVSALSELGGMGSLREITERIKNRGLLASIHSNKNWRNNVRAVIQRHCSQTQSYRGAEDLFYSVYGLGEGYWGLRSMQNTDIDIADAVNPIIQREIGEINESTSLDITEKEMIIKARVGQGLFRDRIIQKYKMCVVTGIDDARLLTASHIKPWRSSNNAERLSSENGLLLSPLYDRLFDNGLITFDNRLNIIISKEISEYNKGKIVREVHMRNFTMSAEMKINLDYHRDVIFKG